MLVPRLLAAAVACAITFAAACPARAARDRGPLASFQDELSAASMRAPGHVAIAVQDIVTGLTTGVNAGAEMPAASTIKIPVMVEVFRQLVAGRFDLNTLVTVRADDRDWGSGDLSDARVGTRYPVGQLLSLMIDVSDNTATNMLIRLVGRQQINHTMAQLGLSHTRLTDFIRSDGPIRWALRSSPADMVHLLDRMARSQLIDEWSSRAMIEILRDQQHNGLLPEPLPSGTEVAHKTGTLHDTLNDVGIVYMGSEPYVIAVMTTDLPTLESGRRFIRGVSRMTYDALERFAMWRERNGDPFELPADTSAPPIETPDQMMWTTQTGNAAPPDASTLPAVPVATAAPAVVPTSAPIAPPA
jgi:beta-lactamase class A